MAGLVATAVTPAHGAAASPPNHAARATTASSAPTPSTQGDEDPWHTLSGELTFADRLSRGRHLEIVRRPSPYLMRPDPLTALPRYDPSASPYETQIDLREQDLSSLDLQGRADDLLHADFDTKTAWPRRLPAGFDPKAILELGKNPGLNVRDLHRAGVTGKGVGIAIIDQTLLVDHAEYRDRLRSYEEIHVASMGSEPEPASMHGPGVASIAVGRTTGVAPKANLYYIGTSIWTDLNSDALDYRPIARAIDRVLEINKTLPEPSRIRVISCSYHWFPDAAGYDEVNAAVRRATAAGVFVLSVGLAETHGLRLDGLGRDPTADPDQASSYRPGIPSLFNAEHLTYQPGEVLLAPMDARTTAAVQGPTDYYYSATSGLSWAVPYLAALYALTCQVDPRITPEEFWAIGLKTGAVVNITYNGQQMRYGTIVAPVALIDAVRAGAAKGRSRS